MSAIFGGSKSSQQSSNQSTQQSYNQAYPWLMQNYGGGAPATNESFSAINALLGGDTSGFDKYKQATGYNEKAINAGKGVAATGAASGLLNSGALGKAFTAAQSGLDQEFAGTYLANLFNKGQLGLGVGNLLSGAGGTSYGQSTGTSSGSSNSKNGMGSFLGSLAGGLAASDRRLKTDIRHIYNLPDGLKVYQFKYRGEDDLHIGVMADEVALLRPEALGPVIDGYGTVNYDNIWDSVRMDTKEKAYG